MAALALSCGGSSKAKPTVTRTVAGPTSTGGSVATPEATRTESEAVATYLQIKENEVPASATIAGLVFVDSLRGWATNSCEDFAEDTELCDLLATTDGGKTWRVQHREFGGLGTLHFFDAQTGLVINGAESILRTTDGGVTWSGVGLRTDAEIAGVQFVTPDKAFGVAAGVIFEVNLLGERAGAWLFNFGSSDCSFSTIAFPTADEGWAGGRGENGIACSVPTTAEGVGDPPSSAREAPQLRPP